MSLSIVQSSSPSPLRRPVCASGKHGAEAKKKARGERWERKGERPLFLSFHPPANFNVREFHSLFVVAVRAQMSQKREAIDNYNVSSLKP